MRLDTITSVVQYLGVDVIFGYHLIPTKVQDLIQVSQAHTTTRQEKGTAFLQATKAIAISKSKRLKCLESMFKAYLIMYSNTIQFK